MASFTQFWMHYLTGFLYIYLLCVCTLVSSQRETEQKSSKNEDFTTMLYMSKHCRAMLWDFIVDSEYIYLDDQTFLMAHPMAEIEGSRKYIRHDACFTTFSAPPRQRLVLHILDMAIDFRQKYKSRLYIYDGFNGEVLLVSSTGLYGETKDSSSGFNNIVLKDYISSGQGMTLMFNGYLSKRFYGFEAVITPIRKNFRNGTCPGHTFQCEVNLYCIATHLTCNGVPNCGERDNSDESEKLCNAKTSQLRDSTMDDLGLMIGCGVSILVLLLAVIWVGVMCQKRHRLRHQMHQLTWQQGEGSPPEVGNSRWFPGVFHDRDSPSMFRGPPPSYTDSVHTDEGAANLDLPPPYAPKCEGEGRTWSQHGQAPNSFDNDHVESTRPSHVIANPGALSPPVRYDENPPSYDEGIDVDDSQAMMFVNTASGQLEPSAPSPEDSPRNVVDAVAGFTQPANPPFFLAVTADTQDTSSSEMA